MWRRWLLSAVAIVAILGAAIQMMQALCQTVFVGFDPKIWEADVNGEKRAWMLPYVKKTIKIGMSRAEVLKLLGKPDYQAESAMSWCLTGDDRAFLKIRFDKLGHVKALEVWEYED